MEAKELRIGNYVSRNNETIIINSIGNGIVQLTDDIRIGIVGINEAEISPIPLTEEWLVNFGFVKDENLYEDVYKYIYTNGQCRIAENNFDSFTYFPESLFAFHIDMTNVHQLQNIYFAITGDELTIK